MREEETRCKNYLISHQSIDSDEREGVYWDEPGRRSSPRKTDGKGEAIQYWHCTQYSVLPLDQDAPLRPSSNPFPTEPQRRVVQRLEHCSCTFLSSSFPALFFLSTTSFLIFCSEARKNTPWMKSNWERERESLYFYFTFVHIELDRQKRERDAKTSSYDGAGVIQKNCSESEGGGGGPFPFQLNSGKGRRPSIDVPQREEV